jgi:hypothetical protein
MRYRFMCAHGGWSSQIWWGPIRDDAATARSDADAHVSSQHPHGGADLTLINDNDPLWIDDYVLGSGGPVTAPAPPQD